MSKILPVKKDGTILYHIRLQQNFSELSGQIAELGYPSNIKIAIISDTNVSKIYGEEVVEEIRKNFKQVFLYAFPAGEEQKNISTVNSVYEFLIQHRFDRHDLLIALGGGVVGDLTGFTAATYLRGVDFIQVPTSLLSQVDSSIGGKTGVDFLQYKNMVGAFYMPKLVYMNLSVLRTLPEEQLVSGFGEILKHGLIKNVDYFNWMRTHYDAILRLEYPILEEMIYQSCDIKRAVVERDPKEMGERALLNFGHTIGHAIEKLSGFRLLHGECVGLGIVAASYISCQLSHLTQDELAYIEQTVADFGLKTRITDFCAEEILEATKLDKKMVGSQIKFVLLEKPGTAYINRNLTDAQILSGIRYILRETK